MWAVACLGEEMRSGVRLQQQIWESRIGHVYILENRSMPGIVKVGFTDRKPHERAAELSRATGVAHPFSVAWARECINAHACEYAVHRALARFRVNARREFFKCDVETAKRAINREADQYLRRRYRKPIRWGDLMKYLYLVAAVCGFIAVVSHPHESIWWILQKGTWVLIAIGHLLPHGHFR